MCMKSEDGLTWCRLGIELAKVMVLQYSNNESSISIGESVRDEDGMASTSLILTVYASTC
jgi:phosphoribosylpyrophosphate synthetase